MTAQDLAIDLAGRLGLRRRPRSWGGNCPCCGYFGAFSVRASAQFSRPLLHCFNGCSVGDLAAAAEQALGTEWKPPIQQGPATERSAHERQLVAGRLWNGSEAVTQDNPAGLYLRRRRVGHLIGSDALRYREDCSHPEGGRFRALIGLVQNVAGNLVAVHRTFLAADGGRPPDADPPKASVGPVWGGAVRLQPAAEEMILGEGIETAAAAGLLLNLPAWATISAGNLAAGLELPATVRSVVIAADNDLNGVGQAAAGKASARWRGEGRQVRIVVPDQPGQDFADVLMSRARG